MQQSSFADILLSVAAAANCPRATTPLLHLVQYNFVTLLHLVQCDFIPLVYRAYYVHATFCTVYTTCYTLYSREYLVYFGTLAGTVNPSRNTPLVQFVRYIPFVLMVHLYSTILVYLGAHP